MTDAQTALAQVREALAAGPTASEWTASIQRNKRGDDLGWIIEHPNGRIGWASLAYADTNREARSGDPERDANALLIAACNPVNMATILAHVDAQAAEIEELRERCHEYAMALADKEQR